jgi:hypothetical protein
VPAKVLAADGEAPVPEVGLDRRELPGVHARRRRGPERRQLRPQLRAAAAAADDVLELELEVVGRRVAAAERPQLGFPRRHGIQPLLRRVAGRLMVGPRARYDDELPSLWQAAYWQS